jgi:hypothetical protein
MTAEIGLMIFLGFAALLLIVISYSVKTDDDDDGLTMFIVGLIVFTASMLGLGVEMGLQSNKQVKHKIEPQVKVECVDNKCDTTYVYKFKETDK